MLQCVVFRTGLAQPLAIIANRQAVRKQSGGPVRRNWLDLRGWVMMMMVPGAQAGWTCGNTTATAPWLSRSRALVRCPSRRDGRREAAST